MIHHLFPTEHKISKNVSENGNQIFKKPRPYEITCDPSTPKIPTATNYTKFKTQLCTKFRFGHCRFGNKCYFAHGIGELKHSLPNLQLKRPAVVIEEDGLGNGGYRMLNQSNVCRMFYFKKECTYGDNCKFFHGCRESSSISIGTKEVSGGNRNGFASLKPVIKKHRLCNKWEMKGSCSYGKMCCFAHGLAELEKPASHIELVSGSLPGKTPKILLPMGIRTCYKRQMEGMGCAFMQKKVEKISGIYADWIEDMPFRHNSFNKAEECS